MKHRKTYADMERHPGDMTDFRRPAYSVRHPDTGYSDTQNMSIPQQSVAGYPKDEYNTQNVSTGQQNEAEYLKSEYGTHKPSAAALIRAQGEQIRETPAEYIARKYRIRGDADGRIQSSRISGACSRSGGAGGKGL